MRLLTLAAILCCTVGIACASDLKLIHATVYTAPDQPPMRDAAVLIHDGKIAAVGATASIKTPHTVQEIDCTGMTITAGFWNSHVHILPAPLLHADQKPAASLSAPLEFMFTQWGFTTIFDISSILSNTVYIRSQIAKGTVIGPRILTTGEPFWAETPAYVKQYLADNKITMPETTSVPQAVARVDQEMHDGADGIKIFAGAIEYDGIVLLPADIARAVVDEAHKDHRLVF
jgi:imidazolonepropionase-like amidohydrolase